MHLQNYTCNYTTLGGSSYLTGESIDYNFGPYNLIFPAGITSVSFNVTINDDNILEGNESFILIIAESSLKNQAFMFTAGAFAQSTVIIIDITSK